MKEKATFYHSHKKRKYLRNLSISYDYVFTEFAKGKCKTFYKQILQIWFSCHFQSTCVFELSLGYF